MSRRQNRKHWTRKSGRAESRVAPHLLIADPQIPADYWGRSRCTVCRRLGKAGDADHIDPEAPPAAPPPRPLDPDFAEAARARDAAILGERDDE
ncbi:hypothetical protein [Paractinoplanes atraurantiacus]|uniref:Uncharacterized protein n=1 Tax=Paractinoplanes atraurantiacus TaxID=1036182 RepID=A0A285GZA3_9ACTN|nr:hypothetical protein [Actinoplanes atraurantiacus]SNY28909.1 hypothetical protein SAMN05421748_103155 [Actinoplanes atraurantiacus]